MRTKGMLARIWAIIGITLVLGVVLFMFVYVFLKGGSCIDAEFIFSSPSGAVLGEEGGIWPAIVGSFAFTLTALVVGGIPALAAAVFMRFFCTSGKLSGIIHTAIQCISGIPSIVLGLFSYSLLVKDLSLGRCVLSAGVALGIMIFPFIEVRAEKAFSEVQSQLVSASYSLGCSKAYTVLHVALPMARGELVSAFILGGCYAMGATAPMIFTGAVAFAAPTLNLLKPAMALPMHLYLLVAQGTTSMGRAFGTAFVMMAIILISNMAATFAGRRKRR